MRFKGKRTSFPPLALVQLTPDPANRPASSPGMPMHSLGLSLLALALLSLPVHGQALPDAGGNDTGPERDLPIAVWRFNGESEAGVPQGAKFQPGPRPPAYPAFPANNTAFSFAGTSASITIREKDLPHQSLRFQQGDSITLEAWVKVKELKSGSYAYLLGKGRSRKPGFPEINQNYALRLKGDGQAALASFLFSSAPTKDKPAEWHRWTTTRGFKLDDAWHHVAVSYTFGTPESIRGTIDGKPQSGEWDMAGATNRAPVADADDLVLGTGNGGGANNTFSGMMDDVSIWRVAVPESRLAARYGRGAQTPPEPPKVVKKIDLVPGKIVIELCDEGMPAQNGWPEAALAATDSYTEEAFGFFEVPHKYIDTGVRADRGIPFLLRASAAVRLPPGTHRLLLRGRGASRLYIDGKLLLSTPFPPALTDGSDGRGMPSEKDYLNLGPDFRFAPPGTREATVTLESRGSEHVVVLETIVGSYSGKAKRRPELGETVVAISPQGKDSWTLLTPGTREIPYTDIGWAAYRSDREGTLDQMNAQARASLREKHKAYWDKRREAATKWLQQVAPTVPPLPSGYPANNAIDHFLGAEIASARAQAADARKGTVDYFQQVKPLLEARCYDCHAGSKVKGGLRLDDHAAALTGGTSDGPGVAPGKPGESSVLTRVLSKDDDLRMPPKGEPLTKEQAELLATWIREGARWPKVNAEHTTFTPRTDDLTFIRRATLDTVGVVPTVPEIQAFLADPATDRRARAIDRLLADPRWADHQVGYWQDVLAENPNILNPTLNNTGPFRWWLYESFRDNKPMDLFVTELLRMKGSPRFGGPAGFAVASQNDSPFAAKGAIVASAFLGVEMKCARCHDAPSHVSKQEDLFQVAAMLGQQTLTVPKTSSVPLDKIHQGGRKPLIQVTLPPGARVEPKWPFTQFVPETLADQLAENAREPRDRLAALITAPQNERFSQVIVNRVWKRLMGRGIVDPVDDWERSKPSHPELLKWLAHEFVANGYDLKALTKLILNSHAYQRANDPALKETNVLFASPAPRRLGAEQIVDSLFTATGKPFRTEEASLDIDGQRPLESSISLGQPRRSWMLTSTSNERDRPSLALPRIQAVADVLGAFGWRSSRQEPTSVRELAPNAMQPAILANGTMGIWLTRLSDDHGITALASKEQPLEVMIDEVFLKLLTRKPTAEEKASYTAHLKQGYDTRLRTPSTKPPTERKPEPYVTWTNHLLPAATTVRQQQELASRRGDPPTERLDPEWRGRMEDVLWALLNSPEFVFTP